MIYAIVDIETTGGFAATNGITEISIHIFNGQKVIEIYETLVNPCQPIPYYIQSMTGITNQMVKAAPLFHEVADKIYSLLHDKIFVAHNVNFDYSFIKHHLSASHFNLQCKRLCTVRLSRKIIPGLASYSLGNLCHSLGFTINDRHRAGGDTEATVKVFQLLLNSDKEKIIEKSLLRNSKEQMLPPHVPKEDFERLPYTPGVYYFHNEKGKIIYVGKAKNIRYRVNSHFSNNSESRQKQNFLRHVYSISFQSCATELMAIILESTEIKKWWPIFNYSQKNAEQVYGIFMYEDQNGYCRLAIEKYKQHLKPVHTFHYLADGHSILRKLIRAYNLCPKLCFIQTAVSTCSGLQEKYCYGACEKLETPGLYNLRVMEAIQSLAAKPSFAIFENGLNAGEKSCILILEGRFYGMGYVPGDVQVMDPETLKNLLTPYKENLFIRNIVNSYSAKFPEKIKLISPTKLQFIH